MQLRDAVAVLHALDLDPTTIAGHLRIGLDEVRMLAPRGRSGAACRPLSRRALTALLHGRHAALGGRTLAGCIRHLAVIAAAYSAEELAREAGVGVVTVYEVRFWLNARGLDLRPETETPSPGA